MINKNCQTFLQIFKNSNFQFHICIQHEKCIQMSTNMPSIGPVILEIINFEKLSSILNFLYRKSAVSMLSINAATKYCKDTSVLARLVKILSAICVEVLMMTSLQSRLCKMQLVSQNCRNVKRNLLQNWCVLSYFWTSWYNLEVNLGLLFSNKLMRDVLCMFLWLMLL